MKLLNEIYFKFRFFYLIKLNSVSFTIKFRFFYLIKLSSISFTIFYFYFICSD